MSEHKVRETEEKLAKQRPQRCETCAFFYQSAVDRSDIGICRRQPPVLMWVPVGGANGGPTGAPIGSAYPVTKHSGWCGEWQQGSLVKGVSAMPAVVPFPGGNN